MKKTNALSYYGAEMDSSLKMELESTTRAANNMLKSIDKKAHRNKNLKNIF
jgi:hypothetical protein